MRFEKVMNKSFHKKNNNLMVPRIKIIFDVSSQAARENVLIISLKFLINLSKGYLVITDMFMIRYLNNFMSDLLVLK